MQKAVGIIDMWSTWVCHIEKHVRDQGFIPKILRYSPQVDFLDADIAGLNWIIISGSSLFPTVASIEDLIPQFEFLKDFHSPILGICLWHQIISVLYWGELTKKEMVDCFEKIELLQENNLFSGILNNSIFREEHAKRVSVPNNFLHIASSQSSTNEAMQHNEKKIFWVQFHPEVSESGNIIFKNFLNLCK